MFVQDYEWLVGLAARGISERDQQRMPPSVTTPEEFYDVMARAALDAVGVQALMERLAELEQELSERLAKLRQAQSLIEEERNLVSTGQKQAQSNGRQNTASRRGGRQAKSQVRGHS